MSQANPIEMFEFRNTDGGSGYQAFTVDWTTGIIRGRAEGFWSMDMTTSHLQRWIESVQKIQRSGMRVRVLADLRKTQAQSHDVADFLRNRLEGIYHAEDRIAMIVASPLVKMQMRRMLDSVIREFFLSVGEAEQWLASFSSRLSAAA